MVKTINKQFKTKTMKKLFLLTILSFLLFSCENNPDPPVKHKYKYVSDIKVDTKSYDVTITKQKGGNTLERGAGGAIIGGATTWLLGSSAKSGAIVGGLIGAATTDDPSTQTYTKKVTDVIYIYCNI